MWQPSWIVLNTHLEHDSIKKPETYELFQVMYTTYLAWEFGLSLRKRPIRMHVDMSD